MTLTRILLPAVLVGFALAANAETTATNVTAEYRDRTPLNDNTTRFALPGQVEVELHSGMLDRRPDGEMPAFGQLDRNGDGLIDENEATSYRLLADDFIHADDNRDRLVSSREYAHWTRRN
jgi:hypothetical protein